MYVYEICSKEFDLYYVGIYIYINGIFSIKCVYVCYIKGW